MIAVWLCVAALLAASPAYGQDVVEVVQTLRLYPNNTVAGVFQASLMVGYDQPQYNYNASEARDLCQTLGVQIATKAQVQEALDRGLETCRFGWVDEQIAVVPRINARSTCGQSQVGVVTWRAAVTKKFDVFCFNSSAEDTEPRNITVHILNVDDLNTTPMVMLAEEGVSARVAGSEERSSSSGGKAVVISSVCGVLLVGVIVVVYLKLRRRRNDNIPQIEGIETE